ncbi:MAG: TetR/AcrR family transcriptional regulator [Pseudooceanicola sp.]
MSETSTAERRKQIVQGAFDALMAQGLPHLSYDVIAESAGLTRQLVRYHYPDPDQLMKDVCDLMAGVYREALVTTAGQQQGPARVDSFLDFYFDMLDGKAKPRDDQVYDAMFSLAARSEVVRGTLADQYKLVGQVLSHEFSVQFPDLDHQGAQELSWLFVCLMYGHWKMVSSLGYAESHRDVTRRAMDRLIRSYCAEGSGDAPIWAKEAG